MDLRFPFRNLEPTFFAGLIDDPLLLVRIRPLGSNLLFDCGQLYHLAKRVLTSIDAIFISHAHMDHWMGIDSVTRHLHASPKTIDLFGPPGVAAKLSHKLAGYDWNLAENYWGSYRVHEIDPERICRHLLCGPESFKRRQLETLPRSDRSIYQNRFVSIAAETCEHRVDSLIYRIDEQPTFLIDKQQLQRQGLLPGPWLGELKRRFFRGEEERGPLRVLRQGRDGPEEILVEDVAALSRQLGRPQQPAAIGYISDVGFSEQNRQRIVQLLQGVDLLLCETTFLRDGKERARASCHLCTEDVNWLLQQLRPNYFLPMHLSKTYSRRTEQLYQELQPPPGTRLLQIPPQLTPRPLLPTEVGWQLR